MDSRQIPKETPILALVGPTAIGKTSLSIDLAQKINCEIISVDSMQVYRYMDIGTAKITTSEMRGVPHHLIDIIDPDEDYDAARFVRDSTAAISSISERGKTPLLTGGTGLYLKALVDGLAAGLPENRKIRENLKGRLSREGGVKLHEELALCDPKSADKIHPNDSLRVIRGLEIFLSTGIPWSVHIETAKSEKAKGGATGNNLIIGLNSARDRLYKRINMRVDVMLEMGFEEEVQELLAKGYGRGLKSMGSIGYRHMTNYLFGEWGFDEMKELLARDTRRYAKRQLTWFGKIGNIEWFDVKDVQKIIDRAGIWRESNNK